MTGVNRLSHPPPRPSPLRDLDPVLLLALNAAVIGFMWIRHGGIDRVDSAGEALVAVAQLAGLYAGLSLLVGLLLASRAPWLERRYGMDRMIHAHRLFGFTTIWLASVHVACVLVGFALEARISLWDQLVDALVHHPYVAQAAAGFVTLVVVVVVSIRAVRRTVSYETWWLLHIATYAAAALAFGHQTAVGADFVLDEWAWTYWTLLYASVAWVLLVHRWVAPLFRWWRHRFRVVEVVTESPGVTTLVFTGRRLERLPVRSGQFFLLRELTPRRWWKAHPFSLSGAPDGTLRFTVKALGDDSTALQSTRPGARFALEGPYGGFLAHLPTERDVLFIAGGIGITPFRSLIDDLPHPERVSLLYRNRTPAEAVFADELEALSERLGFDLHLSYSRNGDGTDPFDPERLAALVPGLEDREVFIIGSRRLIEAARRGVRAAGVPSRRIHLEDFAY